jgi:hypothetical protein
MNKKLVLIPLIMVCLLAGQLGFALADDYFPHLEVSASSTPLTAGRQGVVTITLSNGGNFNAYEIEAFLIPATPGFSVTKGAQEVVNVIESSKSTTYSATVLVDQSVSVGNYQLNLQLNYVRMGKSVTVTVPITVSVTEAFTQMVELSVSPTEMSAGQTNNVTLKVVNVSGEALSGIEVDMGMTSNYVTIVGNPTLQISNLTAGTSKNFAVQINTLRGTPIGPYPLMASVYFSDAEGYRYKEDLTLALEVNSPAVVLNPIFTVKNLNPGSTVYPGEKFTMNLEVNCSDATAFNTIATLTLDTTGFVSPLSSTTNSLGTMKPGDKAKLTYDLILDGSTTISSIPLTVVIKYINSNGQAGSSSESLTVVVDEYTQFSLINGSPLTVVQGSTLSVQSNLLLIGTGRIQFTYIEALPEGPFMNQTDSSEYLGAVDPDSPVPFSINVGTASSARPGNYSLQLKISYFNNMNLQVAKTISVPVAITQRITTRPTGTTSTSEGILGWIRTILGIR